MASENDDWPIPAGRESRSSSRVLRLLSRSSESGDEHNGDKVEERGSWLHLISVCCKLQIPVFNPSPLSISTRSARGLRSSIAREVPLDFRGRNAVKKRCRIKTTPKGELELDLDTAIHEVLIFANPRLRDNENIAQLIGLTWAEELPQYNLGLSPVLILDYADAGTLADLLQRDFILSLQSKIDLCHGVGLGLVALHDVSIIHGDVKPENILVKTSKEGKLIPKLTDFDLSLRSPQSLTPLPGITFPWNAPEWLEELCVCCLVQTDVFSFGMVVWSVMLNDASPLEHLEVTDRGNEAIESLKKEELFVELAIKTLNGYNFDIAQISIISKVLRSTLHAHPEERNLQTALSFLQFSEMHELNLSSNFENKNIKSLGLFSVPTLPQSKTFSIPDQKYKATARGFHHMLIDHDHLRYVEPQLKNHLVKCLEQHTTGSVCSQEWKGECLFQLSAAYFNGFGVHPNIEHALDLLVQSAQHDCLKAQAIVKRMHDAAGAHISNDIPVSSWLVSATESGSFIAAQDLRRTDLALYNNAMAKSRSYVYNYAFHNGENEMANERNAIWCSRGNKELHEYTISKDLDSIHEFLSRDSSLIRVDELNDLGETALICACRSGDVAIVRTLLDFGANPAITSYIGEGPLHWLSSFSDSEIPEVAELLLRGGAALDNMADDNPFSYPHIFNNLEAGTPLSRAVRFRNLIATKWLLDRGASITSGADIIDIDLMVVASRQDSYLSGDWFGANGLRGNSLLSLKRRKTSPWVIACANHYYEIVELFLKISTVDLLNCHNTSLPNYNLWSRLRDRAYLKVMDWSSDWSHEPADSEAFNRFHAVSPEFTMLYFACAGSKLFQRQALHGANTSKAMLLTIDLLVEAGSDISRVNKFNNNVLQAAVESGNIDVAEYILSHNVCHQFVDSQYLGCKWCAPLDLAIMQDDMPMFKLLLEHGSTTHMGFQSCAYANHKNIFYAEELTNRGESPYVGSSTPITFALLRGNTPLAEHLIEKWPEQLKTNIKGHSILQSIVLSMTVRSQSDPSSLRFIIQKMHLHGLWFCGPDNLHKIDIFSQVVLASWSNWSVETLDEEWENAHTTKVILEELIQAYGHRDDIEPARAVHFATQSRNLPALEILLKYGASPNYIKKIWDQEIGPAPMDIALGYEKNGPPRVVSNAGKKAVKRYNERTAAIIALLKAKNGYTAFELLGYELYGRRVGAFVGYVIFSRWAYDLVSDFGDSVWDWWSLKKRWVNNNLPYM